MEPITEQAVLKIGTRGSPLAMAQAYQTKARLQVLPPAPSATPLPCVAGQCSFASLCGVAGLNLVDHS